MGPIIFGNAIVQFCKPVVDIDQVQSGLPDVVAIAYERILFTFVVPGDFGVFVKMDGKCHGDVLGRV